MKRSHLKKYSASNIRAPKGRDPNKVAAYDCFSKRARVTTEDNPTVVLEKFTIGDKTFVERRQIVRWGQDVHVQRNNKGKVITERVNQVTYLNEVPPTLGDVTKHDVVRPKNIKAAQFVETWQSAHRQGFDTFIYVLSIEKTEDYELHLFQSGLKIFFIKEYSELVLRSLTYHTRLMGLTELKRGKVKFTIFDKKIKFTVHDQPKT